MATNNPLNGPCDSAGSDHELAVISPEAHKLLAHFDERSVHYEVAIDR